MLDLLMRAGWYHAISVEAAFDALGDPERHAKITVDPRSTALVA